MFLIRNLKSHLVTRYSKNFLRFLSHQSSADAVLPEDKTVNDPLQKAEAVTFGQPTPETHPHIIKNGHLMPGITLEEFQRRRTRLANGIQKFALENLVQSDKGHMIIIPSASKKYMSGKIPYPFRQNSDFMYLSGCMEPDTVLLLTINGFNGVKTALFMRKKDKHAELWDGPRTGVDNAIQLFGVDESYAIDKFETELKRHIRNDQPHIWYDMENSNLENINESIRKVVGTSLPMQSPEKFVQSMRLFKSVAEQELMRQTCQIASEAINKVVSTVSPGITEHQIYAMIDYQCRIRGASYLAYPPVVAAGTNSTIIHYINNTQMINKGSLVLMDAGCEFAAYTSDITRTWPIDGNFTEPQKILYDLLLCLQTELIDIILKEGGETLDNLFDTMCYKLGKYLQEVKLVDPSIADERRLAQAGYKFCPHHVSHYLGMDVHDSPLLPRTLRLLPGMVFTVEPGIYIGMDRTDVPADFRGIGMRLEDDVLITENNRIEVLTSKCAKDRKALENIFKYDQR